MAPKTKIAKGNTASKKKASEKAAKSKAVKSKVSNEPNPCQNSIIDSLVKIKGKDYFVAKTMVTKIQWHSVMGGEEPSEGITDCPKYAHISDWYRFIETLKLTDETTIIPENSHLFAAYGTAVSNKGEAELDFDSLLERLENGVELTAEVTRMEPLFKDEEDYEE